MALFLKLCAGTWFSNNPKLPLTTNFILKKIQNLKKNNTKKKQRNNETFHFSAVAKPQNDDYDVIVSN